MELFADGAHVWLRSRAHAAYLYADEDGSGVSWSPGRASLNTAWKVHRLVRGGTNYVLFHGAAYGRYLGLTPDDAPPAPGIDRVCRPVQLAYGAPEQDDVLWEAFEAEDGSGDVHMCHRTYGKCRDFSHPSTMMGWIVGAIPPREDPPELPPVIPPPLAQGVPIGGPFHWVHGPEHRRRIQYVPPTRTLWFDGRSVFQLRRNIANQLGEEELDITLCVRAGSQGRLTPLVTDLPANEKSMEIVVFNADSEDAEEFVYPDVDAQ